MSKDSFLRHDLDNLLEGVQIIGFDFRYIYINSTAEIHNHRSKMELLGRKYEEVRPGIETTEVYRLIKDCLEKGTPHDFNNEFVYPDGTLGWFELRIQPVPEGVLILSIDRSKSKLAEKERMATADALRLNEEKYRYMFANNPQPMWIYDLNTLSFLEVNDAAIENYGYTREEFLSMTLKDIRPPEDVKALLRDVAETEKTYNSSGTWRHLKKNKELMFVEIISHTIKFNGREARHVIVNNITSRKNVEDALRKSEDLFNKAFHGSPSPIAITSRPERKYIAVNESFLRLTGFIREELIGHTGSEIGLIRTEDTAKFRADLDEKGKVLDVEILARSKSGKTIYLLTSSQNIELGGDPCSISTMIDITERKRTEEALIESETKFRKIYEEGPFGMAMVNNEFRFLAANDTFCKITGYTEEELQKLTFKEISIGEYVENDVKFVTMLIKGEIPVYKTEKRYKRKDGFIIWGSLTVTSNYNQDGQFLYNLAILEDITGRKQAEEALRESEEKFRLLIENIPLPVIYSDISGKVLFRNDRFLTVFGYTDTEIPTIDEWWEKAYPNTVYRKRVFEARNTAIAGTESVYSDLNSNEYRITCKDGSERVVVISGIKIGDKLLATFFDITERKLIEEALTKSESEFRLLAEAMPQIVWITRPDGWNIYINQLWVTYTGLGLEESYGNGWMKPFHPDDQLLAWDTWQNATKYGTINSIECRIRRKDGVYNWWLIRGIPVFDSDGKVLKWFGTCTDINELKIAEEEILKLNTDLEKRVRLRTSQLESVNNELEAFSYSVSHDLRAPLRSISGFTQILVDEYGSRLDKEANRLCSIIHENSIKMGSLIDDLLAFSRLNRTELKKSVVQMKEMVSLVYNDLTDEVSVKRIEFNLGDICDSSGDPKLLKQVWINLISNAIKYSSKKDKAVITIGCKKEGEYCVYNIRDNGVGFDMAYVDKLFGVFQRLHGQREFDGTGVGLAIVQRIVQRHGGKAWARGVVDKGAEFYFSLPICPGI